MANPRPPLTLAIDIGGTHIKASILDAAGRMVARRARRPTPGRPAPSAVLRVVAELVGDLPAFDRISAGFPGYVDAGRVHTAPNLGTPDWRGFPLAEALAERLKKPARVLNDADVQGLGVIDGKGLECVLTLGTGVGSSLFQHGRLLPHLELGQHPIRKRKTYDEYLGEAALKSKGRAHWNRRVRRAISIVETLVNYDALHIGGGNAQAIEFALPAKVKLANNRAGITGGIKLWEESAGALFTALPPKR